ncbi:UNVERIFIED_CONTAM: hypothetical protein HDU68_001021 [Siphonaria sp. JEL0065]|nr:hypothetical protein HDU68_001021 [Siphonaria sp. JEL0065]
MNLIILVLLVLVTAANAYILVPNKNFIFYAMPSNLNESNAIVCVNGEVEANMYIGFGIPRNPDEPHMMAADLTIVFYDGTNIFIQHGRGMAADRLKFINDADTDIETLEVFSTNSSSYKDGILQVCFERPLEITGYGQGLNLTGSGKSG